MVQPKLQATWRSPAPVGLVHPSDGVTRAQGGKVLSQSLLPQGVMAGGGDERGLAVVSPRLLVRVGSQPVGGKKMVVQVAEQSPAFQTDDGIVPERLPEVSPIERQFVRRDTGGRS